MSTNPAPTPEAINADLRDQWVATLNQLMTEIQSWCTEWDWSVRRDDKTLSETTLGAYVAPALLIKTPDLRLHVEPIARMIAGKAQGRVDLEAWPTLQRLVLVHLPSGWELRTESGVPWPQPWGKDAFAALARSLAEAAA